MTSHILDGARRAGDRAEPLDAATETASDTAHPSISGLLKVRASAIRRMVRLRCLTVARSSRRKGTTTPADLNRPAAHRNYLS